MRRNEIRKKRHKNKEGKAQKQRKREILLK